HFPPSSPSPPHSCHPHPSSTSLTRSPPTSPLFPYTTLFRSNCQSQSGPGDQHANGRRAAPRRRHPVCAGSDLGSPSAGASIKARSEEHTSELQSLTNLVCRLLLEKKNTQTAYVAQP